MKKIIIKREYKHQNGDVLNVTEEITSDCPKFHKIFDNLTQLCKRQMEVMDFFDTMIDPSDN